MIGLRYPDYNPRDWYWLAADNRLFSSATRDLVADTDPDYAAWTARGGVATVWPRDAAGEQTQEALDAVLTAAGVSAAPAPVITYKADIYRRCTDEEAEAIEDALAQAPVRQRRLFESAQHLDHAAPEFATMRAALQELFGDDRAAELLAAS